MKRNRIASTVEPRPFREPEPDLTQAAAELAADIEVFLDTYYTRENDSFAFAVAKRSLVEAKRALKALGAGRI